MFPFLKSGFKTLLYKSKVNTTAITSSAVQFLYLNWLCQTKWNINTNIKTLFLQGWLILRFCIRHFELIKNWLTFIFLCEFFGFFVLTVIAVRIWWSLKSWLWQRDACSLLIVLMTVFDRAANSLLHDQKPQPCLHMSRQCASCLMFMHRRNMILIGHECKNFLPLIQSSVLFPSQIAISLLQPCNCGSSEAPFFGPENWQWA